MLHLHFIPPEHPLLKRPAEEVKIEMISSEEIQHLIDEMYTIAWRQRMGEQNGMLVGLAAPQLGVSKRIILVDIGLERSSGGTLKCYINPVILWRSEELVEDHEGCFSTGDLYGVAPRSQRIKISAYLRDGQHTEEELESYAARIFQHEVDHLEGIRFPDRLGPLGQTFYVNDKEYENYRQNWKQWPHICSFTAWMKMRGD